MGIINANGSNITNCGIGMVSVTNKNKKPKDKVILFTDENDANKWLDENRDKDILKVDFNATEYHPVIGIWYRVD